mmetsp:Transcript_29553/g.78186  ORF Transcript_29553/g.78186 Transcript_29553/m.78186 type:complete len:221 (-) Transcript_29553:127-789(-)
MPRSVLFDWVLADGRGHDHVLPTTFIHSGGSEVHDVQQLQEALTRFHKEFTQNAGSAKKNQFPTRLVEAWQSVDAANHLDKIQNSLVQCHRYIETLTGPEPGESGPEALAKTEGSVSARLNEVVETSGELVAATEKVEQLLGDSDHRGLVDEVGVLVRKVEDARRPLQEMLSGERVAHIKEAALPAFVAAWPSLQSCASASRLDCCTDSDMVSRPLADFL